MQDLIPGISEDGRAAYFVARGVLDPKANAQGEVASPGQPNLYLWREGQGARFVATLDEEDRHDWGAPGAKGYQFTAAASPSGRYLAFMSQRPLTGYDNTDLASGQPAQEVFRYDSQSGALACLSCDPSGSRPQAPVLAGYGPEEALDPLHLWEGKAVAGTLPEATNVELGATLSLYRPRTVLDDGRVFFNAAVPLVAADSNGDGDVYEYEPSGAGSCSPSAADAGTALAPGGCVSLLSSGAAPGTAAFIDASADGDNVFFYTPARLAVTDTDAQVDVYDARVGGEPAVLPSLAECQGEACQPPAVPPASQTPASSTFRGPGDVSEAGAASSCAKPARRARALSRRAQKLRRAAKRMLRRGADPAKARRLNRKARRLAHAAQGTSKRAKRCRARARHNRRSHR